MTVARLWSILLLAIGAMLLAPGAPAMAETRLAPCIGQVGSKALESPYGSEAIQFVCEPDQARYGPGDFVAELRFAPLVNRPTDPLVFRITSVWQDSARLRFRYADGAVREVTYTASRSARTLQYGAIYEIPVPEHAAALTGMEIATRGNVNLRGVVVGAALMPKSASERMTKGLIALYATFAGLAIALISYNLALWAALRHRFQLIYCGMVGAIAAYVFTSSGTVLQVFPALGNLDRLRLNYVLLALAGVLAIGFMRFFFEPRVLPQWLKRTIDASSLTVLTSAFAVAILAPWQMWWLDRFYFGSIAAMIVLVGPILFFAFRRRSRFATMFALAWSAPILTSVARAAYGFGLIGYSFWLDNGNLLALACEALISSVLITARLRDLSSERDLARAGELSALRLANSDGLTGLLNRRAFIEQAIGRTGAQRLLLVDIDHFKAINDRHGHDAGDQVLIEVAKLLQAYRPAESLAVRLGGEEFAMLLPASRTRECTPQGLLAAIRAHPMPQGIAVTASLGFAEGTLASEDDWKRLYRLADTALYRAKADGRDRACRATDFAVQAAA